MTPCSYEDICKHHNRHCADIENYCKIRTAYQEVEAAQAITRQEANSALEDIALFDCGILRFMKDITPKEAI